MYDPNIGRWMLTRSMQSKVILFFDIDFSFIDVTYIREGPVPLSLLKT